MITILARKIQICVLGTILRVLLKKTSDRHHYGHQGMKLQKVGKFAGGFIDRLNTFYAFLLLVTCFTIFNALAQSQGVLEIF